MTAFRRGKSFRFARAARFAAVAVMFLIVAGDKARGQAGGGGIDPLEVLKLKVKPNVLILLDTSISMRESLLGVTQIGGDAPRGKLFQGKQALQDVVEKFDGDPATGVPAQEGDPVSFMLATFTSTSTALSTTGVGQARFTYQTSSDLFPEMNNAATEVWLDDTLSGGGGNKGNQPWQDIRSSPWVRPDGTTSTNGWNLLYYTEGATNCTATVPAAFYPVGRDWDPATNDLATAIEVAMNTDSCGTNGYKVYYCGNASSTALSVTTLTRVGTTATATTAFAHGFLVGQQVTIAGATTGGTNFYIGTFAITAVTATTFDYTMTGTPTTSPAGGTKTVTPAALANCNAANNGQFIIARAAGASTFSIRWNQTPHNIAGALAMEGAGTVGPGTILETGASRMGLFRAQGGAIGDIGGVNIYDMDASRFYNGETFWVDGNGTLCGLKTTVPVNPPSVKLQRVTNCATPATTETGPAIEFKWAGPVGWGTSASACTGAQTRSALPSCDTTVLPSTTVLPLLRNELPLTASGLNLDLAPANQMTENGAWTWPTPPNSGGGGIVVNGFTPAGQAIRDIKGTAGQPAASAERNFSKLWNTGQTAAAGPPAVEARTPISTQTPIKEKTVLLYVTDGDNFSCDIPGVGANLGDNSVGGANEIMARFTAYQAELLYKPIVGSVDATTGVITGEPESSVTTYVIGFGAGVNNTWMNWIAWGGSGLTMAPTGAVDGRYWNASCATCAAANYTAARVACTTCVDAFQADDVDQLKTILASLINTGAQSGTFTAQQSIVAAVFELGSEVPGFNPNDPHTRYDVLVPNQFQASFELPNFRGKLKAIQTWESSPGVFASFTKWEAGQKLFDRVNAGMSAIPSLPGAGPGQGSFAQLHGGATDVNFGSVAAVKRRIYSTSRNGVFTKSGNTFGAAPALTAPPIINTNLAFLRAGASPGRERLWPPTTTGGGAAVAPDDDVSQGVLDEALGLPTDTAIGINAVLEFNTLVTNYKACLGAVLPANCSAAQPARAQRARREAREMILAFTAGAQVALDASSNPARVSGGPSAGEVLYKVRSWLLAESTLAPPAIVGPPIDVTEARLTGNQYYTEYAHYRDSPQVSGVAQNLLAEGFGLRNPEGAAPSFDTSTPASGPDGRATHKPAMTVAYLPANDMLHAFRAGPSCATPGGTGPTATYAACSESGGEEVWGFVPHDRLIVLKDLMKPQTPANKVYVIATPVRFADVFVDAPGGTMTAGPVANVRGMWRTVLMFGRGAGGKFLTALDVTNRGAYTVSTLSSSPPGGPIVLWSRGNPDTHDGKLTGSPTHAPDTAAYRRMGQTWSVPAIAYVTRGQNATSRSPFPGSGGDAGGVPMVAYVGSGYGDTSGCPTGAANPCEGKTFYTLDVLTGDVVAAVDVDATAGLVAPLYAGNPPAAVQRMGLIYENAIVASPSSFAKEQIGTGTPNHPASLTSRVYFGDVHGRLWKVLSADPTKALLMADLGANQAVGTAAALLKLTDEKPLVFVTSGNDTRATTGPFKMFGFRDNGSDTDTVVGAGTTTSGVTAFDPTEYLFSQDYLTNFRGTIQPATALTLNGDGRVFFGGTRLNQPGTLQAPTPPPCRSSFDSIIFALGATSGGAAYDLNASGNDAYVVFTNSRKTALQIIKEPTPVSAPPGTQGRGVFLADEGLMGGGSVTPPPAPGLQPQIPAPPTVAFADVDNQGRRFPQMTMPRVCQ